MAGSWAAGWVANDLVPAAEFKKGVGCISDATLGAPAASIDISGIVATYAHLRLVICARDTGAVTAVNGLIRFNNDSAANYDTEELIGAAATPTSSEAFAATSASVLQYVGASASAGLFGMTVIDIPNYASATPNKALLAMNAVKWGTATTNMRIRVAAGFWRSSAAINQITITAGSGNFDVGTRATLYAMGA